MRLRLPRRTARLRLTLLYSGMFLLLGTVVIVTIYEVVSGSSSIVQSSQVVSAVPNPAGSGPPVAQQIAPVGPLVVQRNHDVGKLLGVSWVVLAITAILAAVLGWFVAGRVLRPLRSIAGTARTISAGSLHQRLALEGPDDEFKQLGDTLDELLARLEASFDAQRRFVANASHELRTPLTVERTLLQVALADPDASADALRATCEELLAAGIEHERLLESLLTLASSERGLEEREPLDLSLVIGQALGAAEPEIERRELSLTSQLAPAGTTGDPALLERLVANLIENAIEHNVTGGSVEVRTGAEGGDSVLSVVNTGLVIPPGDVERLLEPFQRFGANRTADEDGHHGLGLSIVRAIAAAHDADLYVEARPSGGLAVTVRFHAAA
jgi:signal transduction histidine kinase